MFELIKLDFISLNANSLIIVFLKMRGHVFNEYKVPSFIINIFKYEFKMKLFHNVLLLFKQSCSPVNFLLFIKKSK